jgi:TatD DNase family protein
MIDTHCHLNYLKAQSTEQTLTKSSEVGVNHFITIATDPAHQDDILQIAEKNNQVYCTQGVHPHEAKDWTERVGETIAKNSSNPNVVAVGEIGLDFYYDNSPRDKQMDVFKRQCELACELDLPIVVHSRDADSETIDILNPFLPDLKRRGVIHSFTGGASFAKWIVENDFYIGINGIITFKKSHELRNIIANVPLEKILLETDSPFLAPMPHRGKENAPFLLPHIADFLATFKDVEKDLLIEQTNKNAADLFRISL